MGATLSLVAALALVGANAVPALRATASPDAPSSDGTFEMTWRPPTPNEGVDGYEFEVHLDTTGTGNDFARWYQGAATQSFVSGMSDGTVLARVRGRSHGQAWSAWSAPVRIEIAHHSMTKALTLMFIGFAVFLIIVGYIGAMAVREADR